MIVYLAGLGSSEDEKERIKKLGLNCLNSYWYLKGSMEKYAEIYREVGVENGSKNIRIKKGN